MSSYIGWVRQILILFASQSHIDEAALKAVPSADKASPFGLGTARLAIRLGLCANPSTLNKADKLFSVLSEMTKLLRHSPAEHSPG
jgi:hypothetical protein